MINQDKLRKEAKSIITTQGDIVDAIVQLGYKMDAPAFSRWLNNRNVSDKTAQKIKAGIDQVKSWRKKK